MPNKAMMKLMKLICSPFRFPDKLGDVASMAVSARQKTLKSLLHSGRGLQR